MAKHATIEARRTREVIDANLAGAESAMGSNAFRSA